MQSVKFIDVTSGAIAEHDKRDGAVAFWRRHAHAIEANGKLHFKPEVYAKVSRYLDSGGVILPRGVKLPVPAQPLTPEQIASLPKPPVESNPVYVPPMLGDWKVKGPMMWRHLHQRARNYQGDDIDERKWLAVFRGAIGCNSCRDEWDLWLASHPIPLTEGWEAYFAWTVEAHNAVSERLNKTNAVPKKKIITLDEAILMYMAA